MAQASRGPQALTARQLAPDDRIGRAIKGISQLAQLPQTIAERGRQKRTQLEKEKLGLQILASEAEKIDLANATTAHELKVSQDIEKNSLIQYNAGLARYNEIKASPELQRDAGAIRGVRETLAGAKANPALEDRAALLDADLKNMLGLTDLKIVEDKQRNMIELVNEVGNNWTGDAESAEKKAATDGLVVEAHKAGNMIGFEVTDKLTPERQKDANDIIDKAEESEKTITNTIAVNAGKFDAGIKARIDAHNAEVKRLTDIETFRTKETIEQEFEPTALEEIETLKLELKIKNDAAKLARKQNLPLVKAEAQIRAKVQAEADAKKPPRLTITEKFDPITGELVPTRQLRGGVEAVEAGADALSPFPDATTEDFGGAAAVKLSPIPEGLTPEQLQGIEAGFRERLTDVNEDIADELENLSEGDDVAEELAELRSRKKAIIQQAADNGVDIRKPRRATREETKPTTEPGEEGEESFERAFDRIK